MRPARLACEAEVRYGGNPGDVLNRVRHSIVAPIKIKYAAPTNLIAVYATAEAARADATPTTTRMPHTDSPTTTPPAARIPARTPPAIANRLTTATSGPGTTVSRRSTAMAAKNEESTPRVWRIVQIRPSYDRQKLLDLRARVRRVRTSRRRPPATRRCQASSCRTSPSWHAAPVPDQDR